MIEPEMDENLSRGYVQLGKARGGNDFRFTNGFSHLSPPVDKHNAIYFSLVLAGVGFLLPYNSFIIAVDYFQAEYPGTTIVFDMSLVYIIMAFFAVLVNNLLVETLPLNTRITFGYIVSFITLLLVAVCEVWWNMFSTSTSYTLNLVAIAAVSLGSTVQQSSFYGYTSMLPSRYTQAVMAGESGAGFIVSLNRIVTKLLLRDQRLNTLIFFALSFVFIGGCFWLHQVVRRTDFVQFYLTLCSEANRVTLHPQEDLSLMEGGEGGSGYGVLKLDTSSPPHCHLSFANPLYEPAATQPTYKVEDIVVETGGRGSYTPSTSGSDKLYHAIYRGIRSRWVVSKSIWQYMLSISMAYFVTLCLYPGIESEIVSCKFGSWMPVILMAAFNTSDLIGKVMAGMACEWPKGRLVAACAARAVLVPLLLLTAVPRGAPVLSGEGYPVFFSLLLGLTNGVVGSVPMIQAPSRVPQENRELAGNIMTLSYNFGLTTGSLMAYVLNGLLGPNPAHDPCLPIPDASNATEIATTAVTTVGAIVTTVTEVVTTTVVQTVATVVNSTIAH